MINNHYKNELETLIDNNTLYTQYKPQQSSTSSTLNELSNGTGISSSSSTSSASSTSATSTPFNQHRNTTNNTNFNVNNRRDCLFYHSSDNYRNTHLPYARHHMFNNNNNNFNKNNQKQQQQYQLESIPQEEKQLQTNEINVVIKHAAPFNGSKKIHTVSDLFEEDKKILLNANHFVRNDLNQLSTKSQPTTMMSFNEKRNFFQQQQQQKMINNYVNHHTNNNTNNTNKRNGFSTNPQPAEV